MAEDVGQKVVAQLTRLPGKHGGWAAKLYIGSRHVATVCDPEDDSRDAALWTARMWAIMYKDLV